MTQLELHIKMALFCLAFLNKKSLKLNLSLFIWLTIELQIRYPEITKNISTPSHPASNNGFSIWYRTTEKTEKNLKKFISDLNSFFSI